MEETTSIAKKRTNLSFIGEPLVFLLIFRYSCRKRSPIPCVISYEKMINGLLPAMAGATLVIGFDGSWADWTKMGEVPLTELAQKKALDMLKKDEENPVDASLDAEAAKILAAAREELL